MKAMETTMNRTFAFMICWPIIVNTFADDDDRGRHRKILAEAETRLKLIDDKREFVSATFTGKWLRDCSGSLVLEMPKDGSKALRGHGLSQSRSRPARRKRDRSSLAPVDDSLLN